MDKNYFYENFIKIIGQKLKNHSRIKFSYLGIAIFNCNTRKDFL